MRRRRIIAAGAALLIAALLWFGSASFIRGHIYRPPPAPAAAPWQGAAPQELQVTTADGLSLTGYHWPAPHPGELIVYFHGNAGDQRRAAQGALPLAKGGHGVLIASYRGYGGNPGSPSEAGLFADADAWMRLALRLKGPGRLYVFGHSLGGAMAMEMAGRFPVDGLVTLGTFTSIADRAPGWVRPLLPDRYDNAAAIRRVKAPVFLFHGTADDVIPFESAAALRAASGNRATVMPLPEEGHAPPMESIAPLVWAALLTASPPAATSPAVPGRSSSR